MSRAVVGAAGLAGIGGQLIAGLPAAAAEDTGPSLREYRGPNVIVVRFGGGARRRETIDVDTTYSPFLAKELAGRGTLFKNMHISGVEGEETSHGQGTLNILTGIYDKYVDVDQKFLGARFEAKVPTLFEYLRKNFHVPEHQTLIVNGEDRTDEEFYTFSNHHLFGVNYRSNVLSLFRFKTFLLRDQIDSGKWHGRELEQKRKELAKMEALDYRRSGNDTTAPELRDFWLRWRDYYGSTGFVNPRGDSLLTELTVRAIGQLRPKFLMVNYNDCDYVHWGNMTHYTRGISIMDEGLRRIVDTVEADDEYRANTLVVVVPDCGRDNNRLCAVPCQHHFNTRSAREIFALIVGPGIERGRVVDRQVEQIAVAPTIAAAMGFKAEFAQGRPLEEAFA